MSEHYIPELRNYDFDDFNPRRPAQLISTKTQDLLRKQYGDDTIGIATTYVEQAMATGNVSHLDHATYLLEVAYVPAVEKAKAEILGAYMPAFTALSEDRVPTQAELSEVDLQLRTVLDDTADLLSNNNDRLADILDVSMSEIAAARGDIQGTAGDGAFHKLTLHNALSDQGDMSYPASRRQDRTLRFARKAFNRLVFDTYTMDDPEDPEDMVVLGVKTRGKSRGRGKQWDTQQYRVLQNGTKAIADVHELSPDERSQPSISRLISIILSADIPGETNQNDVAVRDHLAHSVQQALDAARETDA